MMAGLLHPSDRALDRYARDPQSGELESVRTHLAECQHCRDHVVFLRSIPERVAELGGPNAGSNLLRTIQARVDGGEQIILPLAGRAQRKPRFAPWFSAAAAVVIGAIVWSVWPARDLTAGDTSGDLRFSASAVVRDSMTIRYRDGGLFPGARRLVVRARYRAAYDESYNYASRQWRVATLVRQRDGEFTGKLKIPDSVVYAAFAVENEDGTRVDDHGRRLWYLMAQSDGKPSFKALEQRASDLLGENIELAMSVLQERTRLYPDHPAAWSVAFVLERFMLGEAHEDSTRAVHCARLVRLDSLYRRKSHVTPEEAEGLAGYSVNFDAKDCAPRTAIGAYWRQWFSRDSSRSPESLARQYSVRVDSVRSTPARAAALAEEYWPAATWGLTGLLLNNGLNFSQRAKDRTAMLRWIDRSTAHMPSNALGVFARFVNDPLVHEDVLDRLRSTARALESPRDSLRPLERTTTAQAREDSATQRYVFALIGQTLIHDGATRAGLDTLDLAARNGWELDLFRRVAAVRLALGDTSGAVPLVARMSVDPSTTRAAADSLHRLVQHVVTPAEWRSQTSRAAEHLRETLLADATTTRIVRTPRMLREDSVATDLAAVTGGKVAVVAFWWRDCPPSRAAFSSFETLARQLDERGMRLIAVTKEGPSLATHRYTKGAKVSFPVYHDVWGEVGRTFQVFGTPQYFITDGHGRIRFRYTTRDRALAQAFVLQESERINRP